jgi:hypothetical protein
MEAPDGLIGVAGENLFALVRDYARNHAGSAANAAHRFCLNK